MTDTIQKIFELEGLTVLETVVEERRIRILGKLSKEKVPCPKCACKTSIFKGRRTRAFHIPPLGSRLSRLEVVVRRSQCDECKFTWWPQVPFAKGKQRMSQAFINHILDLLKMGTINDVARHLCIGWDAVKEIHKLYFQNRYKEIDLSKIEHLSIDEFAIKKGHSYMTVVSDFASGRIVHAVEGRKAKDISPFLETLKKNLRD